MLKNTIAKNVTLSFLGDIFVKFIGFLVVIAIARFLGDASLGTYSFIITLVWIVFKISELGLDMIIRRDVAREKEKVNNAFFSNILSLRILTAILAFLITLSIIYLTQKPTEVKNLTFIAALGMVFFNIGMIFRSAFYALQKMRYEVVVKIISNIVFLLGILFLFFGFGLKMIFVFLFLRYFLSLVLSFFLFKRKIAREIKLNVSIKKWKTIIKESYFYWLITGISILYFKIDIILLSFLQNETVVGWYTGGYRIIDMISLIPVTIVSTIFPVMSELFITSKEKLKKLYKVAFRYLLITALAIVIFFTILANPIVNLLYGDSFTNSALVLKVLILAQALMFITLLISNLLGAINKQKSVVITSAIALFINILLNLMLIPKYSFMGAGWATLIAEIINVIILVILGIKYFDKPELSSTARIMLAFLLSGAFFFILNLQNLWIAAILTLLSYIILLLLFKVIKKEDFLLLMSIKREKTI